MAQGTVKWFSGTKGFGFITQDEGDGAEMFVHHSDVEQAETVWLQEGQRVEFEVTAGALGPQARRVHPI